MSTALTEHYQAILNTVLEKAGEAVCHDGLQHTPQRAAKALGYLTSGYEQHLEDIINGAVFASNISEMVVIKDLELYSLCEHHLLPFMGKCHIGYLPNGQVLGLSKFARIVDLFARRLQIQENMTQQIADAVMQATDAKGVAVVIEAQHLCMMMRGVQKQGAAMTTSVMRGLMQCNPTTREEFLRFIRR